jgi:hypothetical protein
MTYIYNPTNDIIEVQISGVKYVAESKSTVEVPEEVAKYWVHNLHQFMEIVGTKKVVEIPEEVIVTRESVVAELGEDAVKEIESNTEIAEETAVITKKVKKSTK